MLWSITNKLLKDPLLCPTLYFLGEQSDIYLRQGILSINELRRIVE
jgi:hypothetical protein